MLMRDCSRRTLFGATALGFLGLRGLTSSGAEGVATTVIFFRHAEKAKENLEDEDRLRERIVNLNETIRRLEGSA